MFYSGSPSFPLEPMPCRVIRQWHSVFAANESVMRVHRYLDAQSDASPVFRTRGNTGRFAARAAGPFAHGVQGSSHYLRRSIP